MQSAEKTLDPLEEARRLRLWHIAKVGILTTSDAALMLAALYVALYFHTNSWSLTPEWREALINVAPPLLGVRLLALAVLRAYQITVRYTGLFDGLLLTMGVLTGSVLYCLLARLNELTMLPTAAFFLENALSLIGLAGSRSAYRVVRDAFGLDDLEEDNERGVERVLILGAGREGAGLARTLKRYSPARAELLGFLDDAPDKRGRRIDGIPVLGTLSELSEIARRDSITHIVIAIPQSYGIRIRELVRQCDELNVQVRLLSHLRIGTLRTPLGTVRPLAIEDLLCREPIPTDTRAVTGYIGGQCVLITGGGGSIGSELARQVLRAKPSKLVLLGRGENSIYELEQQLKHELGYQPICLIGDVRDRQRLERIFREFKPDVVFHAAAHKHVPLMEANPEEAVLNNILGTRNLVELSSQHGVKRFVLISTDKAVNPSSIMGASKRIAEMVVEAESQRSQTEFAIVRFGNVLGSRGSVVPLMQKQIAAGGPVTVTHPEITRYFMLIPEAVQLVLQAGALGGHGTLYLLDMGEPVKILELAQGLVRLMGLTPGKDIAIEFTGLRPGEKLYEELLTAAEGSRTTRYERIFVAPPAQNLPDYPLLLGVEIDSLVQLAVRGDREGIRNWIGCLVPTYRSTSPLAEVEVESDDTEPTLDTLIWLKAA